MSAAAFPSWVLLEPYVFRRDDDNSFPDDTQAPFRASGTTSWGADFRIAFSLTDPPSISRLYAHLPGFPGHQPLKMLATHRHLFLLYVGTQMPDGVVVQNFFIFRTDANKPSSSSLAALPLCTVRRYDHSRIRGRPPSNAPPHLLDIRASGLWCGDKEEFVVAELTLFVPTLPGSRLRSTKAFGDICLLRSSFTDGQHAPGKWHTMRVPILSTTDDDRFKLSHWQTDTAMPFQRWLCWIDYHQGILFWDMSETAPTISFLWFPPDKYSRASTDTTPCSGNGAVSVVDDGCLLKFVYVARQDGRLEYGAPKRGTGFTITCHTLVLGGSMKWKEDYTVTSDDLPDHRLHHGLPLFPRVDIVRPQVVHSLFVEFGKAYEKMSVLSINMSTKTVESFYPYMDGNEPCPTTVDIDFIRSKSMSGVPPPFLPCEFPSSSSAGLQTASASTCPHRVTRLTPAHVKSGEAEGRPSTEESAATDGTALDEDSLRRELETAIEAEDYARAAVLLDELCVLQEDGRSAVLAANARFYAAFKDGDLVAMHRAWAKGDHVYVVHPSAGRISGYEMVMQSWEMVCDAGYEFPLQIDLRDVEVRVRGGVAYVTCLEMVRTKGSSSWGKQLATNVFEKVDGEWLMCVHHASHFDE